MGKDYQDRDRNFVDYKLAIPSGFDLPLRNGGTQNFYGFGSYIGAAQTFGRFVKYPFPELLEQPTGCHSLNLGIAGAGPYKFLANDWVIETVNKGEFCVLQIMSGRSVSNRLFHYIKGKWEGTSGMWNCATKDSMLSEFAWQWALEELPETEVAALVEETRSNYINEYKSLIKKIDCPVILLWFSTRAPDYSEKYTGDVNSLLGSYPHFVNQSMLDELKELTDEYVEVVCNDGLPQQLYHSVTLEAEDRVQGDPRTTNTKNEYYPSPEMHYLCAQRLANAIKKVL